MRSVHLTYALAALCFGLSISFWRAAHENERLTEQVHAAEMAQLTAEEDAQSLREKLRGETRALQIAEAAQIIAETSERGLREKLARETKLRESAEAAHAVAEKRLSETGVTIEALNARLIAEAQMRLAAEAGRDDALEALASTTLARDAETAARKSAEGALYTADQQVRILSVKLVQEMTARQDAEAGRKAAVPGNGVTAQGRTPALRAKAPRNAKSGRMPKAAKAAKGEHAEPVGTRRRRSEQAWQPTLVVR
jgi:hypothetical protein